nr:hypothetical protein [Oceanococcus sp. HetDA_MAG_MS8]
MRIRILLMMVCGLGLGLVACGGSDSGASTIKVFKSDGSSQCQNNGTSVEEMQMELVEAGIDVICGQKGNDGGFYCAACGCPTGDINVYTINAANQADAESLGFGPVSDLENYQDSACPQPASG